MADKVKIKVKHGWTVYDGTTQRNGGETLTVSAEQAEQWEHAGWVELVKTPARKAAQRES